MLLLTQLTDQENWGNREFCNLQGELSLTGSKD